MTAIHKLPVAFEPPEEGRLEPTVTVIGSNLPAAYLEEAEPSPLMETASRVWQRIIRIGKIAAVAGLVGGYPLAIIASHKIDSSPVGLSQTLPWAAPEAGVALTLIGRELTQSGWASDRADWRPQARLIAMPAWQEGISQALADYTALLASADMAQSDSDLRAAARLLDPAAGQPATPRLTAAAEALQRHAGRMERGLATLPSGLSDFNAQLALLERWAADAQSRLSAAALQAEGWPASRDDIEAIYLARAHAHVAGEMLATRLASDPALIASRNAAEARDAALSAWRRAATFSPLFVSSQSGTGLFLSDHPATMAFYMAEAEDKTATLRAMIGDSAPVPSSTPQEALDVADGSTAP